MLFLLLFAFVALHVAVINLRTFQKALQPRGVHFPPSVATLSGQCEGTTTVVWHHHLAPSFHNLSQPISTITLTEIKTCYSLFHLTQCSDRQHGGAVVSTVDSQRDVAGTGRTTPWLGQGLARGFLFFTVSYSPVNNADHTYTVGNA